MFENDLLPPARSKQKYKPDPAKQDILAPSTAPGYFGHYARRPNTDQHVRFFQWQQRKRSADVQKEEMMKGEKLKDAIYIKYETHTSKKRFQRAIGDRVQEKWLAYEKSVEERRKKLHELLCREERELYRETVDAAQKGADRKMDEMKQRAEMLKAKREEERLKVVHQKRLEQYSQRCQELRPALAKQHLIESKYCQLQQMRENEARREADREVERMWHDMLIREDEAKKEREVQEMLQRRNKQDDVVKIWDKQIKGQELLKKEMEKLALEDRLEMEKTSHELRKQEINELMECRKKREEASKQIFDQIEIQRKLQTQRKKEENALEEAFTTLTQLELNREKESIQDATQQLKKETAMYRKHLKELEQERKLEDKKLEELLEIHRKEIQKKQDEAKCKVVEAKRKLQQDVLSGRAEQIICKKQLAEEQLKLKEAENELLRMAFDTNERLEAESERRHREAALQYRQDLSSQIEYSNVLRQREQDELKRQLQKGMEEEDNYRKLVEQIVSGEIDVSYKHPFRRVLEQADCRCPTLSNVKK